MMSAYTQQHSFRPTTVHTVVKTVVLAFFAVFVVSSGTEALYGADNPAGRIVSSLTDDRDTIDFGYSMAGNDSAFLYRTVYFINDGDVTLAVRDTSISLTSVAPTNSKTEFSFPAVFPLSVQPTNTSTDPVTLVLRCQSTSFLTEAPEGVNLARLSIRLIYGRSGSTDTVIAERTFILRFTKTVRPVWTEESLSFDSLYAGSTATERRVIDLRNTDLQRTVSIIDTAINVVSGSRSSFSFLSSPLIVMARDSAKPRSIQILFTAVQRGVQRMRVGFVHYNPSLLRNAVDTTSVEFVGMGVEQRVTPLAVTGRRAMLKGDTIDVGSWTQGSRDTVVIAIKNEGNLPFRATQEFREWTGGGIAAFGIIDSLHGSGTDIGVGAVDSLRLVFAPTTVGDIRAKLVLRSDIANRIFGVPDSVKERILYIVGAGRERRLTSSLGAVDFDTVLVNTECRSARSRMVRLRNASSSTASVRYALNPSDAGFTVSTMPSVIPPQSEIPITMSFEPTLAGDTQAELRVESDIDDGPVTIGLRAVAALPRAMAMSVPAETRVFPGHVIDIPLRVDSKIVSKSSRCSLELVYDTTIMRYRSYESIGTASASGTVDAAEKQGVLTLTVNMATAFYTKDTLLNLRFDTSLGLADRTSFSVRSARFGDGPCDVLFPVELPTGTVQLDSLCGLRDKLPTGPVVRFMLHPPSPNPVTDAVVIRYSVPTEGRAELSLHNLVGENVLTLIDAYHRPGEYSVTVPTAELRNGLYVVRMSTGYYHEGMQIVVAH